MRRGWEHVVQVGPLLRSEITSAEPRDGGYVLSYLRRHTPFEVVSMLADCGLPVKVYGLGDRGSIGRVTFHEVDERRFVDDLVGCRALIAAAGNQLIGEALHLGKPALVLPERAHAEQLMNGHFLAAMGCGDFVPLEQVTAARVRAFLDGLGRHAPLLDRVRGRMDGTSDVLRVIERRLGAAVTASTTAVPPPDQAGGRSRG